MSGVHPGVLWDNSAWVSPILQTSKFGGFQIVQCHPFLSRKSGESLGDV
jgi:hypothetical protein